MKIKQEAYNLAANPFRIYLKLQLDKDGFSEEAGSLNEATAHWLKHTDIFDDVKIHPREDVCNDAGHSASAITDCYIDTELRKRYRSAKKKFY